MTANFYSHVLLIINVIVSFSLTIFTSFVFSLNLIVYASSADLDVTDDGESSLYNGDENHKIWTGSHEQLNGVNGHQNGENHYDFYSNGVNGTSTLGRPSRQRQITAPIPVPPPPKEELIKKKKDSKKSSSKSVGSQSLSGTLIRPRPIHPVGRGPPPHPPPHMMYGPPNPHMMGNPMAPMMQMPLPQMNGRFHTIGHHRGNPPPHQMMPHPQMQLMLPPQYATIQSMKGKKKSKKDKMIPVAMPIVPPMFYPPPSATNPNMMHGSESPQGLSNRSRKLAQSTAALDDSGNSGAESPCGTGIYRRKGHLNERAFSYSIRQEHRSRSHGSLASLQFNPPDMKKEREIIQMVSALDINDESTLRRNREMSAGSTGTFGKPRR